MKKGQFQADDPRVLSGAACAGQWIAPWERVSRSSPPARPRHTSPFAVGCLVVKSEKATQ